MEQPPESPTLGRLLGAVTPALDGMASAGATTLGLLLCVPGFILSGALIVPIGVVITAAVALVFAAAPAMAVIAALRFVRHARPRGPVPVPHLAA